MGANTIDETKQVSHYLIFFLIGSMQMGVGVLGFQRIIAAEAGYNAWISVLAAGLSIHIILFFQFRILEKGGGDIVEAHKIAFGKWIGGSISLLLSLYFLAVATTIIRTYLEIVQVWMFPQLNIFWVSFLLVLLAFYIVYSGFRTVTGVAFFGLVLPSYLVFTFGFTFPYSDYRNLLPLFDASFMELVKGFQAMSLTLLGYESVLMFYPFIKEPKKAKKWAHLAVLLMTLFYTVVAIISFAFFSEPQLEKTVWATLSIWKIVEMPFVERFEYLGIGNWVLIILPNVCIALWCGSRIIKRVTKIRQKIALFFLSSLVLAGIPFLERREHINLLNDTLGKIGLYFNYVYIPMLFVILMIARKVRKKNDSPKQENK